MTRQQHHKVYSVKDLTNLILEEETRGNLTATVSSLLITT